MPLSTGGIGEVCTLSSKHRHAAAVQPPEIPRPGSRALGGVHRWAWQAHHTSAAGNTAIAPLPLPACTMDMVHAQWSTGRGSWRGHAWEMTHISWALQQMLPAAELPP